MCLATAYVEGDEGKEEVMHDVAWIDCEGSELRLITLMGESRLFHARIKSIDLLKGTVLLDLTGKAEDHAC